MSTILPCAKDNKKLYPLKEDGDNADIEGDQVKKGSLRKIQLLIIGLVFLIIVIGAVAGGISIKSNKTNNSADESIGDLSNGKVSNPAHKDCSSCNGEKPDIVLVATVADTRVNGVIFRRRVFCEANNASNVKVYDRTKFYLKSAHPSCKHAEENAGTESIFGPTMVIPRGKIYRILLKNDLRDVQKRIGPAPPTIDQWFSLANPLDGRYAFLRNCGFRFNGKLPEKAEQMQRSMHNMPGSQHTFDVLNLHLHGMKIIPHLFEPVGTSDPAAPLIAVQPGECYCYEFYISADHPVGNYWYHPHFHGSSAVHMWGGMLGLIRVVDEGEQHINPSAKPDDPPVDYYPVGIPFVVWDPHIRNITVDSSIVSVSNFLMGQTDSSPSWYLVNGDHIPKWTFTMTDADRVDGGFLKWVKFDVLCATTENLVGFKVVYKGPIEDATRANASVSSADNENTKELEFFRVASDGADLPEAIPTRRMVLGGAQREDIVIPFYRPGRYQIVSEGLDSIQFFCTGPQDAVLAEIEIREESKRSDAKGKDDVNKNRTDGVNRDAGIRTDKQKFPVNINASYEIRKKWTSRNLNRPLIEPHEVKKLRTISMSLSANCSRIPFPTMLINGQVYSNNVTISDIEGGVAEEWTLINPDRNMHPFHVHVVPFQVLRVVSAYRNDHYAIQYLTDPVHVENQWRDTVIVPPEGRVTLRIRFPVEAEYKGKSVLHCHFLAHEDTGMMANMMVN